MIGKYPAKLDEKNRLFVPAKLRSELGEDFYVTLGVNCGHRCLTVYTAAEWRRLSDNFNALSLAQRSGATSLIFMNAVQCCPDKQFRFGLTQFLLDYAAPFFQDVQLEIGMLLEKIFIQAGQQPSSQDGRDPQPQGMASGSQVPRIRQYERGRPL